MQNKTQVGIYLKSLMQKAATGNYESGAEIEGAAAVSGNLVEEVMTQLGAKGTIWNKARKIIVNRGPTVKIPSRVNTLANEPSTGIRSYYVSEADQSTASAILYGGTTVELDKIVCRVPMTEELVWDVNSVAQIFAEDASESIVYKIEREMFLGVGKGIKGIAGDGDQATQVVTTANDVTEANLLAYVDLLHPMAYENAEWYVTSQQYSVILSINFTTPNAIQFWEGRYYVLGFPLVIASQLVATPYHIVLGDFTKFVLAHTPFKFDKSDDIRFLEGEQEFRLQIRIGGSTIATLSELDDGNVYGFFVVPDGGEAKASSSSSSSSSDSSESSDSSSSSNMYSESSDSSQSSESSSSSSEEYSSESSESSSSQGITSEPSEPSEPSESSEV